MIQRIIDEIEKALSHDLYFAALNLRSHCPTSAERQNTPICARVSAIKSGMMKLWV